MEFKRVTELLDKAVKDVPEKIGFVDVDGEMMIQGFLDEMPFPVLCQPVSMR